MEPSLSVVDATTGIARHKVDLGLAMKGLSIRHLAVAADGETVFGCQWEGEPLDGPLLVGVMARNGTTRFLDMPEDSLPSLKNYVGSVALSANGRTIAATSPKGGTIAFWDRASGRYLGRKTLSDVCGIAPASALSSSARSGIFLVSTGQGSVRLASAGENAIDLSRFGKAAIEEISWDNHLLALKTHAL